MVKSWQKYLAELIGTYALVFFGPLSVTIYAVVLGITQPYYFGPGLFAIGTSFGAIVTIMIYALGHISGTHINPAVTISLLAIRKINAKDAVCYIIVQLIGAALAGFTHAAILPQGKAVSFGLTLPGDAIGKNEITAFIV